MGAEGAQTQVAQARKPLSTLLFPEGVDHQHRRGSIHRYTETH